MEPRRGKQPRQPEFEAVLERSIEEGLRHILGESGLQMVLSECPLEQISADPEMFHKVLEGIFMQKGALILEREVGRRLLENVGAEMNTEGRSRRSWIAAAALQRESPARVSKAEKDLLLRFLRLESLPKDHAEKRVAPQIERTAERFALAFKKGS